MITTRTLHSPRRGRRARSARRAAAQAPRPPATPRRARRSRRCARAATASTAGAPPFPRSTACRRSAASTPAYIVTALKAYKSGERSHPSMRGDRRVAVGPGHGRPRRVLRAGAASRRRANDDDRRSIRMALVAVAALAARPRRARRRPRGRQGEGAGSLRGLPRRRRQQRRLPDYPKLGGQYADYLAKALRDYKSGARKNAIMAGFAQALSTAGHREPGRVLRRRSRRRVSSRSTDRLAIGDVAGNGACGRLLHRCRARQAR